MTAVVGGRDRRARRRPLGPRRRGDRRGLGVLLRRQHLVDRQRAGRDRRRAAHAGCCRSTAPGSRSAGSRCRPSRPSTGTRSAPGCASRSPATSGTPRPGPGSASRSSGSGCTPAWPAPTCCPSVVGPAHARDLLLTGRIVDADEALRLGLVSRVHRRRRPSSTRCSRPPRRSRPPRPSPSRLTTLALRDGGHADLESCLQWEALAQPLTLATADLQEGIAAAREKRPPRFTGR